MHDGGIADDGFWIGFVSILAWLVLAVTAARRRMPAATAWRYGAIWAAIFAGLFVMVILLGRRG